MKKNNILKISAVLMSAVFLLTSSAPSLHFIINGTNSCGDKITEAEISVLKSSEYGNSIIQQLENACGSSDSYQVKLLCSEISDNLRETQKKTEENAALVEEWNIPDITERQKKYENELKIKSAETLSAIENIKNGYNVEASLNIVRSYLGTDEDYYKSDAAPNTSANTQVLNIINNYDAPQNYNIISPDPSDEDSISDLSSEQLEIIKASADTLEDVRSIYQYIKNQIDTEMYSGSKKGALITLDQLGGNDVDQAALLIELLRAKNIPARFVEGTIQLTAEQAMELTGAADARTAGRVLNSPGLEVQGIAKNNNVTAYRMKHTWVEAYIPYTDYRGAGNKSGESMWIQLDPSFKFVENICKEVKCEYDSSSEQVFDNISEIQNQYPDFYETKYEKADTVDYHFRTIKESSDEYLPSSLPYTVLNVNERYSHLRNSDRDKLSISIDGETLIDEFLSEIYYFSPVVTYSPATDTDRKVMEKYDDITDVPAYLVNVVPVISIGNKKYTGHESASLGSVQQMVTTIKNCMGTTVLDDNIICGSVYAFNLNLQKESVIAAELAEERMKFAEEKFGKENLYEDYELGAFADYAGKYYFSTCDSEAAFQSGIMNMSVTRNLGLCITGYKFNRKSSFGTVTSLKPGAFYIDVAYNSVKAINLDGNKESEKKYLYTIGSIESYCEGYIWEKLLDGQPTGISTIRVFDEAAGLGIINRYICKENLETELSQCNVNENVKQEVRNFVNSGLYVEIVPETLKIGEWTGTGYIVLNRDDGSASFMLAGGIAGGSSDLIENLFTLNLCMAKINEALAIAGMVQTIATSTSDLDLLKGAISFSFNLACAYTMRYDTLNFIFDYAEGDEDFLIRFEAFTVENMANTIVNIAGLIVGILDTDLSGILETIYYDITSLYHINNDEDLSVVTATSTCWGNISLLIDLIHKAAL